MATEVKRQPFEQPVGQGWTVAIQEEDNSQATFLRMAMGEGLCLRARELAAQRLVPFLGGMNHLRLQTAKLVFHLAENRLRRAAERWIEGGHRVDDALHAPPNRVLSAGHRLIDRLREL